MSIKKLYPTSYTLSAERGFTLIEMIIVIAIIAILASVFFGNFIANLLRGSDSRRKQDLRSVAQGLELYYNDNGRYPVDLPPAGAPFTHPSNPNTIYLTKTPADPKTGIRYCYETPADGAWYRMAANLENTSDPDVAPNGITCGASEYNYGIASTNITP